MSCSHCDMCNKYEDDCDCSMFTAVELRAAKDAHSALGKFFALSEPPIADVSSEIVVLLAAQVAALQAENKRLEAEILSGSELAAHTARVRADERTAAEQETRNAIADALCRIYGDDRSLSMGLTIASVRGELGNHPYGETVRWDFDPPIDVIVAGLAEVIDSLGGNQSLVEGVTAWARENIRATPNYIAHEVHVRAAVIAFAKNVKEWLLRGDRGSGLSPHERAWAEQVAPVILAAAREERDL